MSYVLVSDIHAHKWSLFSRQTPSGVNGRLQIILNELKRAAGYAVSQGARTMVIAGDIMHVRGSIDPHVLNPLEQAFQEIMDMGIDIYAIPGNHDLADKETTELGNAIKTFGKLRGNGGRDFNVYDRPTAVSPYGCDHPIIFVPWFSKTEDLLRHVGELAKFNPSSADLIIHAGIDGVLPNMPGHGLTPEVLADFGFRNVFAGHYHNHKGFPGNVWSIGATTHQTWGDVGTKAGFLYVDDDGKVTYQASRAPRFVDVTGLDEDDMQLAADGNYVRFTGKDMLPTEIAELRKFFEDAGALGTSIIATPKLAASRRAGTTKSALTLDQSVATYVDEHKDLPAQIDKERLKADCAEILQAARAVNEDA
jgi:DNA repair exonuclease SbcCD nuclease subunit